MNIFHIAPTANAPTLEAYFTVEPDYPPEVIADGQLMIALLHHLHNHVAGPDLHASIQMFGLWFSHPDYPGRVRVEPRNQQFRLSYPVPDTWSGWDDASVVGFTNNVVTATAMLFSAFHHQPRPNDWRYHMLDPHGIRSEREPEDFRPLRVQLHRISDQQPESLKAYYQALSTSPTKYRTSQAEGMLKLLDRIIDVRSSTMFWSYTQDTSLTLTDRDAHKPGVTITPISNIGYRITVLLSADRAPWEKTQFEGNTMSLEEAIHMTAVAIERQQDSS